MIDTILTAPYPDATPLQLSEASDLAPYGEFEILSPDNEARDLHHFSNYGSDVRLGDAFITYIWGSSIMWKRSLAPFAYLTAWLLFLIVPSAFIIAPNWNHLAWDNLLFANILPVGLLAVAGWAVADRWIKRSVTLFVQLQFDPHRAQHFGLGVAKDIAVLSQQTAGGAGHLKPSVLKTYEPEQLISFGALLSAWEKQNLEAYGHQVRVMMTGRAETRLRARFSEQSRRLEEAVQLVRHGIAQNPSDARAYDARDVVSVRLERCGWLVHAGSLLLLVLFTLVLPALAVMGSGWLMQAMLPYPSWWPIAVMAVASMGGSLLILGGALIPATMILRAFRGRPVWPDFRLDHRVRIRFSNGRQATLIRTPCQAIAVEFYNLVVRDIRRPVE